MVIMLAVPASPASPVERLLACFQQVLGHDLPNKLVALQGLARLLEQDLAGKVDDDARASLERLAGLTRQIHEQVAALADVGRTCRRADAPVTVAVADVWAEVRAEVQWTSGGRPLRLDVVEPLPTVTAPRENLRRVLLELVRDALRRCPVVQPLRLQLSAVGTHSLELLDDGPAQTRPEQLFQPRPEAAQGSVAGLGLFLARLLAEGWGGTLVQETPTQGGCRFRLELPGPPAKLETEP